MFGLHNILECNNYHENLMTKAEINESYTSLTIKFISEMHNEINYNKKLLYKTINESNSYITINEAFSDFNNMVKNIINKIIQFIKSLVQRFITRLNRLVLSDKHLKKNKDKFSLFDSDDEFEYDMYDYHFDEAIPVINAVKEFSEFVDFKNIINVKDSEKEMIEKIANSRSKFINFLNNTYYDKFRGDVIQAPAIEESEYNNELFKFYRCGDDEPSVVDITKDIVFQCLLFITNYNKSIKDIKEKQKNIEKEYKQIKSDSEKFNLKNNDIGDLIGGGSHKVSDKVISQVDLLIKAKIDQIEKMSSIHSLAFSNKIDAYEQCFIQSKKILYAALIKIEKNHKEDI